MDGVVGQKTLSKIDQMLPPAAAKSGCCSNGKVGNAERALSLVGGANFRAAVGVAVGGITLPSGVRFLTPAQEAMAKRVFGTSLDLSRVVLTDATDLRGPALYPRLSRNSQIPVACRSRLMPTHILPWPLPKLHVARDL
jgi:hypothetical protein